jgi:hypothetical protein
MGLFAVTAIVEQTIRVSHFRFPFAENKRKLPFSVRAVFQLRNSGNVEAWTWRHRNMEAWRWRHGNIETWRCEYMEKWRHGEIQFVDKETNGSYLFANGLHGPND